MSKWFKIQMITFYFYRDAESLTNCISKTNRVCYEIKNPIGFVQSLTFFKATFQHMCAKKNGKTIIIKLINLMFIVNTCIVINMLLTV